MPVNQEMFAEIHKLITENPEVHDQGSWEAEPNPNSDPEYCGTTRCVAGWAVWLGAKALGLVSGKQEYTDQSVRTRLTGHLDLTEGDLDHLDYYGEYPVDAYPVLGGQLLGLSSEQAASLFHDHNKKRVRDRVKSFAETGEDLPEDEQDEYNY